MSHISTARVGAYALASCLVTSLVVGLSGAALAQGTSAPTTTTTTTTAPAKKGCRVKRWCHKHCPRRHHHKATSTSTNPAPAPAAQ
jgi:hypothetical protein